MVMVWQFFCLSDFFSSSSSRRRSSTVGVVVVGVATEVVTLLAALFFTRVERKTLEQCLGESYFHTSPLNIVSDVVLMLSAEFSQKRGLQFF